MLRERLQEHYWLQVNGADGSWSEFDPSFADARRGTAYGSGPVALSRIPEDKVHHFGFSLVYQTKVGGTLKREVLLKRDFGSSDAPFAPIEFRIQPADLGPDENVLFSMGANGKIQALQKLTRLRGLLREGPRVISSRAFDFEGHTFDAEPGGSPAGLMGNMLGLGGSAGPAEFDELQVVLRLTGPGREPMSQTRTLVRAADIRSPTFAPPLLEWAILVQPQWVSLELAGFQMLGFESAAIDDLFATRRRRSSPGALPPIPVQLLQLALLRQNSIARVLSKRGDIKALIDGPMLTISGHRLSGLRSQEGRIATQRTVDIVENAVRYIGKDAKAHVATFDVALGQGGADCILEERMLEEAFPETRTESGGVVLQRAQLEGRQVVLATSHETSSLRAAGLTDNDIDWIRANEPSSARLLVAATSSGQAAWWSVRPDGNSVLRVSGGQG
jgi:hypothetical protein